ncbi:MAG: murein biosynthesis integral membrane protein MurJ [Candidatus Omnitrophica bacterium]|nr:murein biosynthesis integral membrane protein MurJ [Candidatus Omnitrophota bacterium]
MSTNNLPYLESRILRSASVVGAATFVSRITGFFRDVVLAYFFGTGIQMQAFIVAFRLPNLLRNLIGEGATNTTLVPVFSKLLSQAKREEFLRLSQFLFKLMLTSLVGIVILSEIASGALVRIIAPGFLDEPEKLFLAIKMSRITFVYILLIGLVAYNTSLLNSMNNFASSAIAPMLLNLSLIIGAFVSVRVMDEPILGIAWAVIVGGILQFSCQLPSLVRNHITPWSNIFHFKIEPEVKHASARVGRLFWPRTLGAAVYQINVFIDTIIASLSSLVGPGAVAAIYYANRIIQLPLGIFAFALSSALLPRFSAFVALNEKDKLAKSFVFSMNMITVIMLPISFFLILLSRPITTAIFQRGEFGIASSQITSLALLFYSLGLYFFAAVKITLACFYALEDTRRPVKIAAFCLVLNLILNIILAIPLKIGGLALASSISAAINLILLCRFLKGHIPSLKYGEIFGLPFLRIFACALFMIFCINWTWQHLFICHVLFIRLIFNLILAAFIYLAAGLLFKINEIKQALLWILRKD